MSFLYGMLRGNEAKPNGLFVMCFILAENEKEEGISSSLQSMIRKRKKRIGVTSSGAQQKVDAKAL